MSTQLVKETQLDNKQENVRLNEITMQAANV